MTRMLVRLHPRPWREAYGEELRELLETAPLTVLVVIDVLLNAARQHLRAHPLAVRLVAATVISLVIEVIAGSTGLTANILWPPTTVARSIALVVLLLAWAPVAPVVVARLGRRRRSPSTARR